MVQEQDLMSGDSFHSYLRFKQREQKFGKNNTNAAGTNDVSSSDLNGGQYIQQSQGQSQSREQNEASKELYVAGTNDRSNSNV